MPNSRSLPTMPRAFQCHRCSRVRAIAVLCPLRLFKANPCIRALSSTWGACARLSSSTRHSKRSIRRIRPSTVGVFGVVQKRPRLVAVERRSCSPSVLGATMPPFVPSETDAMLAFAPIAFASLESSALTRRDTSRRVSRGGIGVNHCSHSAVHELENARAISSHVRPTGS